MIKLYPAYKDSIIGWASSIPEHWDLKWLKHQFDFEKGKDAQKYTIEYLADKKNGIYPVYSGQTENNGILGLIDTYAYDTSLVILVTTVGAKAMTTKLIQGKYSLSQNCAIIKQKGETKNVRYFHYLL